MSLALYLLTLAGSTLLVDLRDRVRAQLTGRRRRAFGTTFWTIWHDFGALPARIAGTPVGPGGSYLSLVSVVLALALVPGVSPDVPPFPGDAVVLVYLLLVSRVAELMAAMDAAGWPAAAAVRREAWGLIGAEPAMALVVVGLAVARADTVLVEMLGGPVAGEHYAPMLLLLFALAGLTIGSAAGSPVDQARPISELVGNRAPMLAERSGPELGALQLAAAVRLAVHAGLIGAMLRMLAPGSPWILQPLGAIAVVVVIGIVDARLVRQRASRAIGLVVTSSLLAAVGVSILLVRSGALREGIP